MQIMPSKKDKIVKEYLSVMMNIMQHNYKQLSKQELENAILYSIDKRYKKENAHIYNNYKEKTVDMSLYEMVNYIMEKEPIMTAYGVLYQQHGKSPNPLAKVFETFLKKRDLDKNEMYKYPPGSEEFERYNLFQLLDKLDSNGLYGALGASSCLLYNIHVASSITSMARSSISATICFFEMFLNDNVKFRSLNEVITFIHNIISEKSDRNYDDKIILDKNITRIQCLAKIAKGCPTEELVWVPDEKDVEIIWEILCDLDQEDINRIYYKNNLFEFMNNNIPSKAIIKLLDNLKTPFLNPNKPPKEIKDDLLVFEDILKEYVYYSHQIIDRIERNINMTKSITILSDTDSAIVNLDGWYRFILDKIAGRKMNIASTITDCINLYEFDEFGDRVHPGTLNEYYPYEPIVLKTPDLDYDFYNDEIIELKRSINPIKLIPQDGVRYSIINIISYCLTDLANDYMNRYCNLNNSNKNNPTKCRLFLKNEFLFKSVLMTNVKKHYATIHELQEGHNAGNTLDIKGLDMDKTTLNPKIKKEMQKIMYEDILNIDKIDQVKIIKKLAILEKKIFQSLQAGSKEFYKPLQIKPINKYDNPMGIQGIKSSVVWNAIKDDDLISINLEERNSIDIVKTDINLLTVEKIKDSYPETYNKITKLLQDKIYKGQINGLAIPRTIEKIPKWIIEFIDYNTIANDNLSTFPFEEIGLTRMNAVKNNNVNYTNILSL